MLPEVAREQVPSTTPITLSVHHYSTLKINICHNASPQGLIGI